MYKKIKPYLNRLNFYMGNNPKIADNNNRHQFIPSPYKSVVLISADFELAWASRYTKNAKDPYQKAINNAKRARKNIPKILKCCKDYNIPITWATVGHLFLNKCFAKDSVAHPNILRLNHFENEYWRYDKGDWFDCDPCTNLKESPEWYAPDLIQNILNSDIKHEIGCHTFSHIDCSDKICSDAVFNCEINECKLQAEKFNIELETFVHPGHIIGNLDNLSKMGFTSFRSNNRNILGYPAKHKNGLWEFEQTAEFAYQPQWSIEYHIYRYKKIIDRAIKSKTLCYLWFHPSFNSIVIDEILPSVFTYIQEKKNQIWITTHRKYVNWLQNKKLSPTQ